MKKHKKWLALFTAAAMVAASLPGPNLTVNAATETGSVTVEDGRRAETTVYYSQDFQNAETSVAVSPNYPAGIAIKADGDNKYFSFTCGRQNNRNAYIEFQNWTNTLDDTVNEYVIEFDAAITHSTANASNISIASAKPKANEAVGSNYIFNMVQENGTSSKWQLNGELNTDNYVTLTQKEWYHYLIYVKKDVQMISTTIAPKNSTTPVLDKRISPFDGNAVWGINLLSGRYDSELCIDDITVRAVAENDVFGDVPQESYARAIFTSQLGTTIEHPAEGVPAHYPITVKAEGSLGGDMTDQADIEWSIVGLETADGYVSFTKEEGTGLGTEGEAPDGGATAYFNVRNGTPNVIGYVQAKVTVGDKTETIRTPYAVIGSQNAAANQLAPALGYPKDMNFYGDSLVGYQATADGADARDLILNNWTSYGSNKVREIILEKDADNIKSLKFSSSGGTSGMFIYPWASQASQYVIDFTAKFTSGLSFGVYDKTPNIASCDPQWTASYASGVLSAGTESISGLKDNEWYRYVISADPSVSSYSVMVFDSTGAKVGETAEVAITSAATPKYFVFYVGTGTMYLQKFEAYRPVVATMTVASDKDAVKVPETGGQVSSVDVSAALATADGLKVTGAVEWSLEEDCEIAEIVSTGPQTAKLNVSAGDYAGTITVVATMGDKRATKEIVLTTSSDVVAFAKSTASITIPFDGEENIEAQFTAETRNSDGEVIDGGAITYSLLAKDGVTPTKVKGITLGEADGKLEVSSGAAPGIVYVKASNANNLSSKVKVNIHGLTFAFGSGEPEEGYTSVDAVQYTEKLGYGFLTTTGLTVGEDHVTGSADFRFKANVPNGNYVVNVDSTSATVYSEAVDAVATAQGIAKTGSSFKAAVCDGVLDLTFLAGSAVKTLSISQDTIKSAQEKPAVYAIGDSTTNNTANGAASWGNCVADQSVAVPDCFSGFSNNGMAGRDSVNFYNQGRLETVLLAVCPGDYVTVNMGINSANDGTANAYETMMRYYVDGIMQRGAVPVILTHTPDGPVGDRLSQNYNAATNQFTNSRAGDGRVKFLKQLAKEKGLHLIDVGQDMQDWMNTLTIDDVTAYNAANNTAFKTVLEMVQSWYVDHNHYYPYLGIQIGNHVLEELRVLHTFKADIEELDTYKAGQLEAIDNTIATADDSNAVKEIITAAKAKIEALTFDTSNADKDLAAYKAEVDAIVAKLVEDIAAQKQAEAENAENITAFEQYVAEQLTVMENMGQDGDSNAVKKLIADAKAELGKMSYDVAKTLEENKAAVTARVNKLADDIAAQKEAESGNTETTNSETTNSETTSTETTNSEATGTETTNSETTGTETTNSEATSTETTNSETTGTETTNSETTSTETTNSETTNSEAASSETGNSQTGSSETKGSETTSSETPGSSETGNSQTGSSQAPAAQKVGAKFTVSKHNYKVTKSGKAPTVEFTGTKNAGKTIKIPDTVKDKNGVVYKVTTIGKNAMKGNKKVTSFTIGKHVTNIKDNAFLNCTKLTKVKINSTALITIGKTVFSGDKNLGSIEIKSAKLKTVGKNALKNTKKNIKIKVPKKQVKKYKDLFKNKGQKYYKVSK